MSGRPLLANCPSCFQINESDSSPLCSSNTTLLVSGTFRLWVPLLSHWLQGQLILQVLQKNSCSEGPSLTHNCCSLPSYHLPRPCSWVYYLSAPSRKQASGGMDRLRFDPGSIPNTQNTGAPINVYFTLTELFTQHTCNVLAGRTVVIWGYPTWLCSRHWKPVSEILKPYCILESPEKLKKLPLLRPCPDLRVMSLYASVCLKRSLCSQRTALSDTELNNDLTTSSYSLGESFLCDFCLRQPRAFFRPLAVASKYLLHYHKRQKPDEKLTSREREKASK